MPLHWIGWFLIVLSVGVYGLTCPIGHGVRTVFMPSLIPWFGLWFAPAYLGAQFALAWWCRNVRMAVTVGSVFLFGVLAAFGGLSFDFVDPLERYGISMARYLLLTGVCFSGVVVGVGILKGRFTRQ